MVIYPYKSSLSNGEGNAAIHSGGGLLVVGGGGGMTRAYRLPARIPYLLKEQ